VPPFRLKIHDCSCWASKKILRFQALPFLISHDVGFYKETRCQQLDKPIMRASRHTLEHKQARTLALSGMKFREDFEPISNSGFQEVTETGTEEFFFSP